MNIFKNSSKLYLNNNDSGITLIALIITVIILVILAAVSIHSAFQTKLIDYTIKGTQNYVEAAKQENKMYDEIINKIEASIIGDGNNSDTGESSPDSDEPQSGTLAYMFQNGDLKIGDIVSYKPVRNGDNINDSKYNCTIADGTVCSVISPYYVSSFQASNNVVWKVLGIEGSGKNAHILLVSSTCVPSTNDYWYMHRCKSSRKRYISFK